MRSVVALLVTCAWASALGAAPPAGPTAAEVDLSPHPFAEALPAPRLVEEPAVAPWVPKERHFARAAGEVVLMEVLPWSFSRYVSNAEFAHISIGTVRQNLETGFTYDRDNFQTDQFSHPYHGSLFFGAARSNGYSFWESGAFAFAGSFVWEVGMESEPPAFNDLVNTTLGGMDRGEIAHRLGTLLRDNTARGGGRFWRELGAAVLDPMGAFNRLLDGELAGVSENPPDRLPSRFVADVAGFYRSATGGLASGDGGDQGGVEVRLRYGDPFDGERHSPYEWFDAVLDVGFPAGISNVESRGVLTDRALGGETGTRQRLAVGLRYVYYDNGPISFGGQSFDLSHLALFPLRGGAELRTEAGVAVFPMAALAVDYEGVSQVVFGRGFDYGPVADLQASARVRRREIDLVRVSGSLLWQSTTDGVSRGSRVHSVGAEARLPVFRDLWSVGAGWGWSERTTTYDAFPTVRTSGSAFRLLAGVTFR